MKIDFREFSVLFTAICLCRFVSNEINGLSDYYIGKSLYYILAREGFFIGSATGITLYIAKKVKKLTIRKFD